MKKILLFASALAGLFLAGSCQRENLEPAAQGGVTYEISLPAGPQTKGEGGYEVYDLHYEVYRHNGNTLDKLYHETVIMEDNKKNLPLDLLNDQNYTVIFWAQETGSPWIDASDLQNIQLMESVSNNDHRDAFCAVDANFLHDGAESRKVTLTRPFAQVNIATTVNKVGYDITPKKSLVTFRNIPTGYDLLKGETKDTTKVTFDLNGIPGNTITVNGTPYTTVAMNYVLVADSNIDEVHYEIETDNGTVKNSIPSVPVKKNYRTNIIGNLLTSNATYTIELKPGFEEPAENVEVFSVSTASELASVIAKASSDVETNIKLKGDINLNDLLTKSAAPEAKLEIPAGKELLIDLNGNTLYGTSNGTGKNFEMIDVRGNLTVVNGTVTAQFLGQDMGWGASTNVFNITAGGVLNLKNVTAKNLGGSAMAFVAHLNNWGEATINVENSVLESPYIAVRVFNSGYDMNNVTIKNSTLKGKYCFWVHNYKKAGDSAGDDSTLALDIYNGTNTYEYTGKAPVLFGFANPIYYNAEGCQYVGSLDAFNSAIKAGTSVVLEGDIDYGTTQLAVTAPIRIDLGGHTLTTANNWGGISLKNGPSIVNGTINHIGNTAAIKAWNVAAIEDVTINVTPTEGKIKGGIVIQSGAANQIGLLKNVTITGATNGIETYECGWTDETPAIGYMENVNIDATEAGILLSADIAKAKDCQIKGEVYGINMQLKGEFKVGIDLENCVVEGTTASIYAYDEKGISNTKNCSLTLTYDAATTLTGDFIWDFEDECKSVVTLNRPE